MRQALASRTVVLAGEIAGTMPPPSPGEIAELECLGRDGMGIVYKARQISLNRLVAIKILAPEREHDLRFSERFAGEAELLAKLSHPHIVTIHDFGTGRRPSGDHAGGTAGDLSLQNRRRRVGLLQITGFTDGPVGLEVRYKPVQAD